MITQKNIAEHLGMAPKTVANILSGQSGYRYNEETRNRVIAAAEKLGYRHNRISRALKRGRSNLIGIINFGAHAEIAQKTQSKLPRFINAEGFDYLSIDLNWHGGDIARVIDEMIQARVEGVMISHMVEAFGPHYTTMLAKAGIPAVTIYGDEKLNIPIVADDARSAFFAMTRHLQCVGHRRLMLLVSRSAGRPTMQRVEGFQLAMRDFAETTVLDDSELFGSSQTRLPWTGTSSGLVLRLDISRRGYNYTQACHHAMALILAMDAPPDAIVCFNDLAAFGAFTAAFEAGLRVPDDVSITGGDNDLFGTFPLYGLTTIEKDLDGACGLAVETLAALVRKQKTVCKNHFFPSSLVLRTSCGRRPEPGAPSEVLQSIHTLSQSPSKPHQHHIEK
jgi:DNA-binding LacI/PurR family transcriptional regulator